MLEKPTDRLVRSSPARWALLVVGMLFTVLGVVGAFLPILPTTPFLLIATACFVRSSPRFHERLLAIGLFGPYLSQWQRDRTVPPEAKRKAYGLVIVSFSVSIALVHAAWMRVMLGAIGVALLGMLACLPTKPRDHEVAPDSDE